MDDFGQLKIKNINPKLFWARGAFLVVGPSGLGKTTTVVKALQKPSKYMDLIPGETTLWIYTGASHDLEPQLRQVLDFSIFNPVHFLTESIGDSQILKNELKSNDGKKAHCIFIDDYLTYSKRDTDFIKELIMKYKQHEKLCIIIALHQLSLDKTGTTSTLLGQVDRLIMPKSAKNSENVKSLTRMRSMAPATRQVLMSIMNDGDMERKRGLAVYDFGNSLFINNYHDLQANKRVIIAYGKLPF